MMNFEKFKSSIISLEVVYSIRDKVPYEICSVQDNVLTIKRGSTEKEVKIQLDELYKFYTCETEYTIKKCKKIYYWVCIFSCCSCNKRISEII